MENAKWYKHPRHGFMLKVKSTPGWNFVVTSLVLDSLEMELDEATWNAHKLRMTVNAGSGAMACEEMRSDDHNPEFHPIPEEEVPSWIKAEFIELVTGRQVLTNFCNFMFEKF